MKRYRRNKVVIILLFATLPLFFSAASGRNEPETVFLIKYEPVKESVSHLIRKEMRKNDITGLSIALVDDQQVVWAQGFGYADEKKEIEATPETMFRIGSLTKVLTASAAMQLAEQGKIDIDKPLLQYLPEFSIRSRFNGAGPITLRDLMTHHSGLPSNYQKGMWCKKPEPFTTVVSQLKGQYTAYPPGYLFSYSNVGYDLLGHVLERVSGHEYVSHLYESLLQPLNMIHSGFNADPGANVLSKAYHKDKETEDPLLRDVAAGGMFSTVLDLGRFMEMIFANGRSNGRRILKPETLAEMLRPQNENVPLDMGLRVGLGWMLGGLGEIDIKNAGAVAHHAGATLMFRSQMIILPEHKLGVVVLSNSSTAGRVVSKVAARVLVLALEAKTGIKQPLQEKPAEVDTVLPQDVLKDYAGHYASIVGIAEIIPKYGHFHIEAMNRTFQLVPHADGRFGIKYVLLGLFQFSLGELDYYEISRARVAGHEILKAGTKGSDLLIAEKIQPVPVSVQWQKRVGKYTIENLGDDFPVFEKIRLRYDDGLLLLECSMPLFFKGTFNYPLKQISDTEVIIAGLGRGMGETISVVRINGTEMLSYSGYRLRKVE